MAPLAPAHHEHPQYDPDGIPARVVGRLAYLDVLFAGTVFLALVTSSWWALGSGLLLVALLVRSIRRARRERIDAYPDAPDLQE